MLLFIGPAIDHANRRRQVKIIDGLLDGFDGAAEIAAFQSGGDGHIALQVLAADLGLSRELGDLGQ